MYRAGLPSPGARLLTAIKLVRPGQVVADIGCDHGKLAVYLALAGLATKVIAVDKRPIPLSRARALAKQTGCEAMVNCRLGNGLAALQPGEATEIVIAGMSGETMIEILAAAPWVQNPGMHFVFVPATRAAQLRSWLYSNGFALLAEEPVAERGRVYTVLSAKYTGQKQQQSPFFCELGLLAQNPLPPAKAYIAQRLRHLQKRALAPLPAAEKQALNQLIKEVEQCLP
ncbi:class I SAM-dependent methyltransferase [Ruminococcaceae bacterium OttesenSCG-928-A16]|nr:class I SAM-dependent methyltransferase [Ruminococcaceae bacterium OttesenSCG-928-A16]